MHITVCFRCESDVYEEIYACDSSLESTIEERAEELDCDKWDIEDWPQCYKAPSEFSNLDDYGEYMEGIEEFGEAYHYRYAGIGSCDMSEYCGEWGSVTEFVQTLIDVPDHLKFYIDWDKVATDYMMDFSEYNGHIFRD